MPLCRMYSKSPFRLKISFILGAWVQGQSSQAHSRMIIKQFLLYPTHQTICSKVALYAIKPKGIHCNADVNLISSTVYLQTKVAPSTRKLFFITGRAKE